MFMDPGIRGTSSPAFRFAASSAQNPDPVGTRRLDPDVGSEFLPGLDATVDKDLQFSEIFSDINLGYITRMIMEENMEDKGYMNQGDSPDLGLGPIDDLDNHSRPNPVVSGGGTGFEDDNWIKEFFVQPPQIPKETAEKSSQSSLSSSSNSSNAAADLTSEESHIAGLFMENHPLWQCQFRKGQEVASKFLPEMDRLAIGQLGSEGNDGVAKEKRKESRGRNKSNDGEFDLEEGRSIKQSAAYEEGVIRSQMFDEVLLIKDGTCSDTITDLIETLKNEASQCAKKAKAKASSSSRSRGKKHGKKDVVDLRTLLIHCAQSVAADDHRNANELLKQIRQHSSASGACGDATQKLAQIFADGLEARIAGTGSRIYHSLMEKRQSALDILKALRLYIAACPFKRISHFFANQTIMNLSRNATRLHIIDFGINFGFQWPCLIQQLSMLRPGFPPKLRITGIDVPQRGFRPAETIDETGRRLDDYCRSFKVPFEYNPIAAKWEDIRIEDLKIRNDEVLVVNCLYRFRNLADETVFVDSPRDIVLNNIRKMNPDVFIHGVINGSYSAPFFVTRFREALFFYSSLFDMLETTIPRNHPEKLLIQNELFGREAINVVACEGAEREERPETYKQWQVRNLRAGFKQLPLSPEILQAAKVKVRSSYHKDFVIDADGRWMLQGWKGRIIYALSTWIPTAKGF